MKPIYKEPGQGWDRGSMAKLEAYMIRERLAPIAIGDRYWIAKVVALVEKLSSERDALRERLDRTLDRENHV